MTILNYDESGFIVGVNRMSQGIKAVSEDTQEIVQILKSQNQIANTRMAELTRAVNAAAQAASHQSSQNSVNNQRQRRQAPTDQGRQAPPVNPRTISQAPRASNANPRQNNRPPIVNGGQPPTNTPPIVTDDTSRRDTTRERDANGRFTRRAPNPTSDSDSDTGNDNDGNPPRRERDASGRFTSKSALASAIDSIKGLAKGGGGAGSVDPLIESFKETKELLSPLGRGAKLIGRGAKFSLSKFKAMKRREPLPVDQDRHNNENEKLLDKIWKAILKTGSGEGGGLGGLLGGRGRGRNRRRNRRRNRGGGLLNRAKDLGGRGLRAVGGVKGLGAIGAIAGISALAMDWKDLNHKEKSASVGGAAGGTAGAVIGGTLGSVVPVVGTAVGAVVGGYLGSKGGEIIGETVSPHVQSWTASLSRYNLAGKMDEFWKTGMKPVFSTFTELGSSLRSWLGDMFNKGKSMFGFGDGEGGGYGGDDGVAPAAVAANAADFAIKNASTLSLGACAEYVNNAFQANGLKASGHGKDVAGNLSALNKGKFEDVAYDESYVPKVGDVMSMPSSKKSKHNYGHVGVYTKEGWVSDYKQGEKYGNTAAPNADYYEDIQSGRIKPKIVRMINDKAVAAPRGKDAVAKSNQAMDFFTQKGWSKQQAAGITGNLQKESMFNPQASGDSGKAYGVAQWHPDRQANFKKKYGKNIQQASYKEQLDFVNHELTNGTEQAAGNRLRKATTAAQAGAVVSQFYERPKNVETEKRERAKIASGIETSYTMKNSAAGKVKPANGILGFSMGTMSATKGNVTASSSFMPASNQYGYDSAGLPALPSIKIPKVPALKQRLDSGGNNNQTLVASNNENISQNVTDRDLAHAITGGLGHSQMWG